MFISIQYIVITFIINNISNKDYYLVNDEKLQRVEIDRNLVVELYEYTIINSTNLRENVDEFEIKSLKKSVVREY